MSIFRWLLLAATIVIYRVWFPDVPPSHTPRLDYDLVVIALIGLYRGQRVGAAAGWFLGFLAYAAAPEHLAWGGLLGALLGWVVGHWRQRLFLEQIGSRWVVFVLAFFAYKLLHWVIILGAMFGDGMRFLFVQMIPSTLIDATVGVLMSVLIERSQAFGYGGQKPRVSEENA